LIIVVTISVVINAALNMTLIPLYGAQGSAIAAIISQYFCGLACYFSTKKYLKSSFRLKSIITYLSIVILLILIFYLGSLKGLNEVMLFLAGGLITACIMFVLIKKERLLPS
jgi:O-antigen/teichoic acid export membrane protein